MLNAVKLNAVRRVDYIQTGVVTNPHRWVTVINPINRMELLQACDNCGVVKSQNTLHKSCAAESNKHLISGSLRLVKS